MVSFVPTILLFHALLVRTVVSSLHVYEAPIEKMQNKSYWDNWKRVSSDTPAVWRTRDRMIVHQEKSYPLQGISFNGIENLMCNVPLGLSVNPLQFYMDFLHEWGFNALRLPLSYEVMANPNLTVGTCVEAESQMWPGMVVDDAINLILDEAHARNISVLFDLHTIGGIITPMPWTESVNENMVVEAWISFLRRFVSHPALMGIEIKNEPHDTITLDRFLEHCAKVIHNIEVYVPEYKGLYFISGVQISGPWGGSFSYSTMSTGFQRFTHPTVLCTVNTPTDRFVFNPHVYGPAVRGAGVSSEGPKEWEEAYGFITRLDNHWADAAIIPTEWGGTLIDADKDYFTRWIDWHVHTKGLCGGGFWWTLAPFSADTGGLLGDDYTINMDKMTMITQLMKKPRRHLRRGV
jgi:endoglucanase